MHIDIRKCIHKVLCESRSCCVPYILSDLAMYTQVISDIHIRTYTINPLLGFRFWHHSSQDLDSHITACFLMVSVDDAGVR
jgi:hypothetical protein